MNYKTHTGANMEHHYCILMFMGQIINTTVPLQNPVQSNLILFLNMQFNKESQWQNEDKLSLVQEEKKNKKTLHIREIKHLSYGRSGG